MSGDQKTPTPTAHAADRRRSTRVEALVRIDGQVLPFGAPAILRDINVNGLAVCTTLNLTPGAAYRFRFPGEPHPVVVTGRLVHSMRVRTGDERAWYFAGFQFADWHGEQEAIATLLASVCFSNSEKLTAPV